MPIVDGKYVNPGWVDGGPPALDAEELNAMSNTVASSQVQNNHTHTADKISPSAATGQKYFASGDHTVDEVLSTLGDFKDGISNEYIWKKITTKASGDSQAATNEFLYGSSTFTAYYADSYTVSGSLFQLVNPSTTTLYSSKLTNTEKLIGKYVIFNSASYDRMMFFPANATFYNSETGGLCARNSQDVVNPRWYEILHGYVNSKSSNAYPPTVSDGYTYIPLGQIGSGMTRTASGGYVGTGTNGINNPITINMGINAKFILISGKDTGDYSGGTFPIVFIDISAFKKLKKKPSNYGTGSFSYSVVAGNARLCRSERDSDNNSSISFFGELSEHLQYWNQSGCRYDWTAIG